MKIDRPESRPIALLALLLAWLVPGAGHLYLGKRTRGIVIFLVIAATFWSGVMIGGVMTVDYHNQRWWFAAEMLTGVHGLVGWYRQRAVYRRLADDSEVGFAAGLSGIERARWNYRVDRKLAADGIALAYPTNTVARAYAGVAGLLNLMCMFDAVMLSLLGFTGEVGATPAGATPAGARAGQEDK